MHTVLPNAYVVGSLANLMAGRRPFVMSRLSLNFYHRTLWLYRIIEPYLLHRLADITIGNAHAVLRDLRAEGVPQDKLRLVYNGIDGAALSAAMVDRAQARLQLGIASEASLWKVEDGAVEPLVSIGEGASSRRARATARAALRRGGLTLLGSRTLRSSLVRRFSTPCAVIVARVAEPISRADAFLSLAASALAPIFERELLLERSAEREQTLVSAGEQRLMRIGFDLHDGPIQDVLALGAEVTLLRDQIYPFILATTDDSRTVALAQRISGAIWWNLLCGLSLYWFITALFQVWLCVEQLRYAVRRKRERRFLMSGVRVRGCRCPSSPWPSARVPWRRASRTYGGRLPAPPPRAPRGPSARCALQ